jgi:anhydro-N-acetylmuramic acid kinase
MRVAGIMSGTSLDGIDVAIVDLPKIRTVKFLSTPYPAKIRERLLAVSNAVTHTSEISRLHYEIAELYAKAVQRAGKVDLIGCHGQTIYHEGRRNTFQIGEAAVLAERTGTPVVSNFRARDIAAGGQGAPLVPFVDYRLFRHRTRTRVASPSFPPARGRTTSSRSTRARATW